mmetsp:Transcript_29618/g.76520  ORF Transcript_29618/g.76520 Transcript_29618/m.76520 type:complete len:85 (-) Transcript_29618:69-323(-)
MLCSPSTKSFCGAMYAPELVSMSKRGYSPIHLCCSAVVSNTVFLFVTNLLSFSTLQLSDLCRSRGRENATVLALCLCLTWVGVA